MQRRVQKKKRVVEKRKVVGLEDMILLADTKDSGICENLKERLGSSQIYTFIGHVSQIALWTTVVYYCEL